MVFELVQDFSAALQAMPQGHPKARMLRLVEEALRRDIHFIVRHPTTLFQCLWNTCWWYDCPEAAAHYIVPEGGWRETPPWSLPGPKLCDLLAAWRSDREDATPGSARPPSTSAPPRSPSSGATKGRSWLWPFRPKAAAS